MFHVRVFENGMLNHGGFYDYMTALPPSIGDYLRVDDRRFRVEDRMLLVDRNADLKNEGTTLVAVLVSRLKVDAADPFSMVL